MPHRVYHYIGPEEILEASRSQPAGFAAHSKEDVAAWLDSEPTERTKDGTWVATFTLGVDKVLYLAPRRSEHVACASGGPVLSAGEISIGDDLSAVEVSNQSTGYCPEPDSWIDVSLALDRLGVDHPGEFTNPIIFRRCELCRERNIVKDCWYYCGICNAKLPEAWNF